MVANNKQSATLNIIFGDPCPPL